MNSFDQAFCRLTIASCTANGPLSLDRNEPLCFIGPCIFDPSFYLQSHRLVAFSAKNLPCEFHLPAPELFMRAPGVEETRDGTMIFTGAPLGLELQTILDIQTHDTRALLVDLEQLEDEAPMDWDLLAERTAWLHMSCFAAPNSLHNLDSPPASSPLLFGHSGNDENTFSLSTELINRLGTLTERQKQIVFELLDGSSNKIIARRLDIMPSTVKAHLRSIFSLLGVANRQELLAQFAPLRLNFEKSAY